MSDADKAAAPAETIVSTGPWPFITRRVYHTPGQPDRTWQSRHHRKNLPDFGGFAQRSILSVLARSIGMAHNLNYWIGILFSLGSALFMAGSILSLAPSLAASLKIAPATTNAIFFAGSLLFTTAAFLQLYQADNAPPPVPSSKVDGRSPGRFGWRFNSIGWVSSALQFVGTLLFNINTFDAMSLGLDWMQSDLQVWLPDVLGSVLFLSAGYLAFIEGGHKYWTWQPKNITWLVTFINLLGCGAFMLSAGFAFNPSQQPDFNAAGISLALTLVGATAFLIGALLSLPESVH